MQDKVVYERPCLVTPIGSNIKRSNVKPYARCIVRPIVEWGIEFL